jgi:hypothetical protein
MKTISVARLPDGGFVRQILTIMVNLNVVWQAKNIYGGLQISGGFPADFINSAQACFLSGGSRGFWRFWSLH